MIVRDATPEDFPNAVALYEQLGGALPVVSGAEGARQWQNQLAHGGTSVLIVENEDTLVSIVTLHILPNMTNEGRPYALIENVITDRGYRGQGAGRLVMQAAIDRAWAADAYKIDLLPRNALDIRLGSVPRFKETDDEAQQVFRRTDYRDIEGASGRCFSG